MVSLLLESGANINAQDDAGKTPLMYAIKGYNEELIKELLKNGADLTLRDKDGESALSLALASHMARIVDIIMKYQKGWSFAELIRVLSKKEVLKLTSDRQLAKLVELCVDFYPASENSKKLVEQCVRQKKSALLHQLLKKGVDPNMTIHNGKPLLDLAKELKAEEVVYVLEEAIKGQGK